VRCARRPRDGLVHEAAACGRRGECVWECRGQVAHCTRASVQPETARTRSRAAAVPGSWPQGTHPCRCSPRPVGAPPARGPS
jgi:hypothetical protein